MPNFGVGVPDVFVALAIQICGAEAETAGPGTYCRELETPPGNIVAPSRLLLLLLIYTSFRIGAVFLSVA